MKIYTVLLVDGTVGTISEDRIDYYDIEYFIDEEVTIHLHDENGNEIEKRGQLVEVLY